MADRETLYRRFGVLLVEAIVLVAMEEINILRLQFGLPVRTHDQLIQAIDNKLSHLDDYDWSKLEKLAS